MTASTADYYGILGLTPDATLADVKKAYRIIASGTTGRDARWVRFDPQRWTIHTTGTLTKILLIQTTPVTHLRGWYGERRPHPGQTPQRSLARHHSVCPPLWRITTIR